MPEFAANGKDAITVRQLMTHTSGLPALIELWKAGRPRGEIQGGALVKPTDPPGKVFRYSDLGFMALGRFVEQVSGLSLDRAIHDWIARRSA